MRAWLLFIFSGIYLYLFVRVLWRVGDEGILVWGAQRVTEGALPYRDFFEVMGPGSFYLLAFFFNIFGTTWIVARLVLLATGTAMVMLIYWMTRRLYRGPADILPAIFFLTVSIPLWPATNHHWDSDLFALLTIASFFLFQDKKNKIFLLAAGVLAGITSCFIQQKGLFVILALAIFILIQNLFWQKSKASLFSLIALLFSGYVGVGISVLAFFYFAGGLPDLVYSTLIWPLSTYHTVNICPYGFGLFELMVPWWQNVINNLLHSTIITFTLISVMLFPLLIILVLPFLSILIPSISYLKDRNRSEVLNSLTLPYFCTGIALWASELHRKDITHLIYGSPILLIIIFWGLQKLFPIESKLRKLTFSIIACGLIIFGTFNALVAVHANQRFVTRRGTVYTLMEDRALEFLHLYTQQGEPVFVYPYYPMYYFLANIKNPTRFTVLVHHYNTKGMFDEVIRDLERHKVKYILWDTVIDGPNFMIWFPQYKLPAKEEMKLEQYIESKYELMGIENGFRIMRRREG